MKVDPIKKIMLSRSIELSDANSPKAPTWRASCRCFTTDSLPRGYPGQLFGLRRIAEFGGYAKRLTIYTGSGPRLGRVITLRPVLALACLRRIALSIGYAFSSYNGYPHQPFIVQALRGVVCVLFRYKVRVLSYASGAFPCII